MPRPRIFVSHSNNDPHSSAYIKAIESVLGPAGFDVLVDRTRLQPGARWRDEIYTWMGLCHAAVILVSDAAIQPGSIWVPRETSILLWRHTLDPKFEVIPACIGNVSPADLTRGVFADMQLQEILAAPAATPQQLTDALTSRLSALTARQTPLETLSSRIAELFRNIGDTAVEEAGEAIHINLAALLPAEKRHTLALELLQQPLADAVPALEVLAEFLDPSKADQLLSIIAPSWVDLCAARWLAHCGSRKSARPAVILNASTHFAAAMYVHRASCKPPKTRWHIVSVTGIHGEKIAEEIAAEVEDNLMQEFRLADDPFASDARQRLYKLLQATQDEGRPVFVALRFTPGIASALPAIQRLLPAITFVLLSGDEFPGAETLSGKNVMLLEPKLQPGKERQAQTDFDYARSIIRPEQAEGY
jgi:hypothetical protein